jgi:hypothetical protein
MQYLIVIKNMISDGTTMHEAPQANEAIKRHVSVDILISHLARVLI